MAGKIERRLAELGHRLPEPMVPVATYVPYYVAGKHVWIAGQGPVLNGEIQSAGIVGADIGIEEAIEAARLTGLNLLSQLREALNGDLDRTRRVVKLGGFVRCTPAFTDQPKIINGASDLMVAVFGEAGRHARTAVGVPTLPFGTSVEIDGVFEID